MAGGKPVRRRTALAQYGKTGNIMTLTTPLRASAVAVALLTSLNAASAATTGFTFDLGCDAGVDVSCDEVANGFDLAAGDLILSVGAGGFVGQAATNGIVTGSIPVGSADLTRTVEGVGVETRLNDSGPDVGAQGPSELVTLGFSQDVTLTSLTFGGTLGGDLFRFFTDLSGDGEIGVGDAGSTAQLVPFGGAAFGLPDGTTGDFFGVSAVVPTDNWRLLSVSGTFGSADTPQEPVPGVSPVPLPAAGWLLLGGFAGLLGLGRHRKAA